MPPAEGQKQCPLTDDSFWSCSRAHAHCHEPSSGRLRRLRGARFRQPGGRGEGGTAASSSGSSIGDNLATYVQCVEWSRAAMRGEELAELDEENLLLMDILNIPLDDIGSVIRLSPPRYVRAQVLQPLLTPCSLWLIFSLPAPQDGHSLRMGVLSPPSCVVRVSTVLCLSILCEPSPRPAPALFSDWPLRGEMKRQDDRPYFLSQGAHTPDLFSEWSPHPPPVPFLMWATRNRKSARLTPTHFPFFSMRWQPLWTTVSPCTGSPSPDGRWKRREAPARPSPRRI
jgi:hypothetical protein